MNRAPRYHRASDRNGAALIIVLAFVLLLTVLVVAFFSRAISERQVSNSSAGQAKVDLFAQGAADTIVDDLKQEISAGSTGITGTDGVTIYLPGTYLAGAVNANSATAVPYLALSGTTGLSGTIFAPNLLKRSACHQPLYSGTNYNFSNNTLTITASVTGTTTTTYAAPNRAANASTSGTSLNGRYISLARWNKGLLLPKSSGTSSTDFTPITSGSNIFLAPDWILVARDGSNPTAWNINMATSGTNSSTVTGRYAYAIYDEGGLLDMNVAGFPSGSTSLPQYGNKGSLAWADLTQLTDSSGNPVLNQSQVDAIVGWRNYATAQPPGTFPNFGVTGTNIAATYYNSISSNTVGFLTTNNPAPYNNQSDRMFTSRQQLIAFLSATGTLGGNTLAATQNALQYLGTFSRDLEQPSFVPDPARPKNTTHAQATALTTGTGYGGNDDYDPTGAKQDAINPCSLNVRDSSGQPILKRRFPLSRLALMQQANQTLRGGGALSAALSSEIHSYFGLTWDATNSRWLYTSPDQASVSSTIKTLAQIASVTPNREPDFFETLYAVINCDTLGKQHGCADGTNLKGSSPHLWSSGAAAIDGSVEFQIIQIGANLIDQYDPTSYPTCIAYNDSATSTIREFYGIKNLPYLAGWTQSWYRMKKLVAGTDYLTTGTSANNQPPTANQGTVYETWVMIQPILWNPHAPNAALNPSLAPTSFRVLATSVYTPPGPGSLSISICPQVRPAWWGVVGWQNQYPAPAGMTGSTFSNAMIDGATSVITFNAMPNTSGSVPASFQEPYRLLYHYPAGTSADAPNSYVDSLHSAGKFSLSNYGAVVDTTLAASDAPVDGQTVIGFFGGKCWTGPYNYMVPAANLNVPGGDIPNCLSKGRESDNLQFRLQYQMSPGSPWVTYDVINQVECYNSGACVDEADTPGTPPGASHVRGFQTCIRADPRTDRWGLWHLFTFPLAINPNGESNPGTNIWGEGVYDFTQGTTLKPTAGYIVSGTAGVVFTPGTEGAFDMCGWTTPTDISDTMVNVNIGSTASAMPGNKTYYVDSDGVLRRATGAWFTSTTSANTNDGLPFYTGNYNSRPVILNRPFQSVAEMGYAFSGTPWKELDLFTPESGDAALLDAFCLNELNSAPAVTTVAGKVNLNTNQPKVLQALLSGASKAEGGALSTVEAANAAQALVNWTHNTDTTNKGPLRNRGELVGKFVSTVANASTTKLENNTPIVNWDGSKSYSGYSALLTGTGAAAIFATAPDGAIERRRECVMRALADSGNTRTWNLMIDLIAQVGRYPASATNLNQFIVEGETRYWVHLAIDRYTGKVVAKLVEPVSE